MKFLNTFEDHVAGILGAARAPFSFKKLAKQAAHEMEDQTLVVNGVNTAPALYTILIANDDDPLMAPYYPQLSREVSEFVKAQAEKKRYTFVGEPLVRFMIDPSLKGGKFSVFAENVDAPTLGRLYEEERAYQNGMAAPIPVPQTVTREAIAGMGGAAATGGAIGAAASIAANMANARANQAPAQPLAQLVDVVTRETLEVNSAHCVVGRERSAADVILRDPNVSRRHAELTFTGSDWSIEDLNSTNGTFVNNRRITRCPLRNGDLLTFGLSNFEFRS